MLDEIDQPALVLERDLLLALGRSSWKTISRPRLRNAIVCNRSSTVRDTNSVPSAWKIVGSGQNVMVVPVERPRGVDPTISILPCGLPPLAYSWR